MCTVNNMTTDGDKDNPSTGYNCYSIDQVQDYKGYSSRYTTQFKEFYSCTNVGLGEGSIYQDEYLSQMIEVATAIQKQANPRYTPNSNDKFTNNLKLGNGKIETVIKGVFENNAKYLYQINFVKNVIDNNMYNILQETKLKIDKVQFINKYDCGFIK